MTPLLKTPPLDKNILKHYRPVSNLQYVSKLVEKIVAIQLSKHLMDNDLYKKFQSAYRAETAVTHVSNDILWALDNRQSLFLVLLNMSAHSILLTMVCCSAYSKSGTASLAPRSDGSPDILQTGPRGSSSMRSIGSSTSEARSTAAAGFGVHAVHALLCRGRYNCTYVWPFSTSLCQWREVYLAFRPAGQEGRGGNT